MGRSYFMNTQIKIAVMMIVHVCKGIYIEKKSFQTLKYSVISFVFQHESNLIFYWDRLQFIHKSYPQNLYKCYTYVDLA